MMELNILGDFLEFSTRVHEPTDRRMDKASYRVACPRLKIKKEYYCNVESNEQAQPGNDEFRLCPSVY